jgi:ATP/maltotriose-dependent transcriptional regulator MalT
LSVRGGSELEDRLAAAELALEEGSWERARELFQSTLAADDGLTGPEERAEAYDGLGWAAWWLADSDLTFSARESAFRGYREADRRGDAARIGALLAADYREFRAEPAIGRGWLERSRGLLEGLPESADHGMVLAIEADYALLVDQDPAAAIATCEEAIALGRRISVPDLEAIGLAQLGTARVSLGEVDEGMRSLDQALTVAISDQLEFPFTLGWSICCMISACEKVGDFRRATEWCDRAREFIERWGGRQLLGICRSSYGTVLAAHGDWTTAEDELTGAVSDLEAARPGMAPGGVVRLAGLRLRQGRLDEARELLARAGPAGLVGRGELALAEGDADAAAELAARALRRLPAAAQLTRFPALELLVQAETARGNAEAAREAVADLERAAEGVGTPYVTARVRLSRGRLERAESRPARAREAFEDAIDCFEEASAPYDAAVARLELARSLAALGRSDRAESERAAALDAFETLGATADAERAAQLLPEAEGEDASGEPGLGELTARELEVLALVARGLSDAEIAAELVLSPHTVHRHVANVRSKLRLGSRAAAVAYASRAGLI